MKALLLLLLTVSCLADTVTMKDGTFLKGRIERIASGVLEMRVPALGEANVQRLSLALVESFVTDDAVLVSSGGVVSRGPANAAGGRVASRGGLETSPLDIDLELWRDPSLRPADIAGARQWTTQADVDVSGRNGVVTGSGFSAGFSAKGVTKADTVIAGVRLLRAESGNLASADDLHATVSYETNPTDVVFWYARSDTGYDNARLIDFFSVNAAGWGFRLHTDGKGKLDARLGLAHRFERYASPSQSSLAAPSAAGLEASHAETFFMSSSDSMEAKPCMTALARLPDLNSCSCLTRYSGCCCASLGFSAMLELPSAAWQATQTVE